MFQQVSANSFYSFRIRKATITLNMYPSACMTIPHRMHVRGIFTQIC